MLSAGITAVIVDALIGARLAVILGGVRGKPRHHVVVCGLGRVGTAVAVRCSPAGYRSSPSSGAGMHRGSSGPAIEDSGGGCRRHQRICSGGSRISRADAVLAVTDDEAVNLEIALVAKDANPSVRVVARVLIMTSQAGWSGGCSSVPRAASPCWQHRRSPRLRWDGGRT